MRTRQNYLHGAAILTLGVLATKALGAVYKIPLGNLLGDEGYAHFMVAYNIYSVFLTLSTTGLPAALSRLISEADALDRPMRMRRIFQAALVLFSALGLLGSLVMYLFPVELAAMMNEVGAAQSIWALSPALFFVCLSAALRGYAQGRRDMTPTAVSQVLDAVGKTAVGLLLAGVLARRGESLALSSAGAIFGVTAGSVLALCYLLAACRRRWPERTLANPDVAAPAGEVTLELLRVGVPITLGACVMSFVNLVDARQVLRLLQTAAGLEYPEAKNLYGIYGKAQTLYNLPVAFVVPLNISILPAVSALTALGEHRQAAGLSASGLRLAALVSMPLGLGLTALSNPIMHLVYPSGNAAGGALLAELGAASVFVCLAQITTAVLQAHGLEGWPVLSMALGGAVKVAVNRVLVGNPAVGILGAPVGTLACYLLLFALNAFCLRRLPAEPVRVLPTLWRAGLSAVVMAFTARGVYEVLCLMRAGMAVSTLAAAVSGAAVYLIAALKIHALTIADLRLIPYGEKLAAWLGIS